jgi:serine/threonine protein kinase
LGPSGKRLGDYVVEHEIARGGQGVVLAASHHETQRPVALKLLTSQEPSARKRFRQEAKILAALDHPNVLRVFDLFEHQNLLCMALERVEGSSLEVLATRGGGRLDALEVCALLLPLSDALTACHRRGVVHRDLKPANVVVEEETRRPVLLDFGLAQRDQELLPAESLDRSRLSVTGEIKGTLHFLAPEQVAPQRVGEVGPQTDVYGLGGLILSLVGGSPPSPGSGAPAAVLRRVLAEPAPDLWTLCPEAPAELAQLCRRCLEKDPGARPSLAEVASTLAGILGQPAPAFALAADPVPARPLPGQPLGPRDPTQLGPYRLERKLGQGGMGAVYLGRHHSLGAARAIKVSDAFAHEARVGRFAREVEHLARVRHAQVVGVHEGGREGRWLWYAMDLVEGEPLDDLLLRGRPPLPRALALAHGIAGGVAALHAAGIVHRDLKPANVVVNLDGSPVVIDLGLALAPERDDRLTKTGAWVGTPRYMSPDQLRGSAEPTVDVYALGMILFELLTGEAASGDAETPAELIGNLLTEARPRLRTVVAALPQELDDLCARLLDADPARRPQHAGEVQALLAELIGSPSAPRRRRRGKALAGALLLTAAGLAAAGLAASSPTSVPSASEGPELTPKGPDPRQVAAASETLRRHTRLQDLRERAAALAAWLQEHPEHPELEAARAAWREAQQTFPLRRLLTGRDVQEIYPLSGGRVLACCKNDAFLLDSAGSELFAWSGSSWVEAQVTKDERVALLGRRAATLERVDLLSGASLGTIPSGLGLLEAFALSPDGETLAVGGRSRAGKHRVIGILSLAGGELRVLGRVEGTIRALRFSGEHLLVGTGRNSDEAFGGETKNQAFDNQTRIYDLRQGAEVRALRSMAAVDTLHVLPDGTFVAGSNVGEIIHYAPDGALLQGFVSRGRGGEPEFGNGLLALATPGAVRGLTHIGEVLYVAEGELTKGQGSLSLWTLAGERLRYLPGAHAYRDAATDGELLYLAGKEGIEVWLP